MSNILKTLSLLAAGAGAATLYVTPNGAGTKDGKAWASAYAGPAAAVAVAKAGDSIRLQGGTYKLVSTLKLANSGTASQRIYLFAEDPATKRALLDFSGQGVGSSNQGVYISGDYWHIKGLDVFQAGDNGTLLSSFRANNLADLRTQMQASNLNRGLYLARSKSTSQMINIAE